MTIKTPHIVALVLVTAALAVVTMMVESNRGQPTAEAPKNTSPPAAKQPPVKVAAPKQAVAPQPPTTQAPVASRPKVKATGAKARPQRKTGSRTVKWDAPIQWVAYDAGVAQAKAENKPILMFVYADW